MRWTDITSDRAEAIVENLFGESIQLHEQHLLKDVFRSRPVIVHYDHWWQYTIEGIVAVLFIIGIWCGRRSRFLWLALSFFALDMLLHVGLGFGLNEVYIMSAHWIYVIPLSVAFLLKAAAPKLRRALIAGLVMLTLWLFAYNITLIAHYLL